MNGSAPNQIAKSQAPPKVGIASAAPSAEAAALILWNCQFEAIPGGAELGQLTAGDPFTMKCAGPAVGPWQRAPQIKFTTEEQEFTLKVLNSNKMTENDAELTVTGYKPGHYKPEKIYLEGPEGKVAVMGLEWKVQSVLNAKAEQPPKPNPPFGPVNLSWPWWLWTSALAVLVLIVGFYLFVSRRRKKRQSWLDEVRLKNSVLAPFPYFQKEMRNLMRNYQGREQATEAHSPQKYVAELEKQFFDYFTREFQIPVRHLSRRRTVKDMRRRYRRVMEETESEFLSVLNELDRARGAANLTFKDGWQLQEMIRETADQMQKLKEARQ